MATETDIPKVAAAPVVSADAIAKIKALEAFIQAIRADYAQLKKQFDYHVDMYNKHVAALHK